MTDHQPAYYSNLQTDSDDVPVCHPNTSILNKLNSYKQIFETGFRLAEAHILNRSRTERDGKTQDGKETSR